MHRVPIQELSLFLETQNIPKVISFLDGVKGRPEIFKKGIEEGMKIGGLFLEFGVCSGGTTNTISSLIPNTILYGFDSFQGLKEDYTDKWLKGSMKHDIPKVNDNVKLIVGYVEDTYPSFIKEQNQKIAFMHMDVDIYSATKFILTTSVPYIQVGTIIQFDEIFETEEEWWYQDEFKAWNEFLKENNIEAEYLCWAGFGHCSYKIRKINAA